MIRKACLVLTLALSAVPVIAQDHRDVVDQVKREVLARGIPTSGPCGAFAITSRVVWRLRGEGWGLIHSTGNGCPINGERYRADATVKLDGTTIDILGHSEDNEGDPSNPQAFNFPAWDTPPVPQPGGNWRAPFDPDGGVVPTPAPVPVPVPQPAPQPTLDLTGVYLRLNALETKLYDQNERILADNINRSAALANQNANLSVQLKEHDEKTSALVAVFGNRYVQLAMTTVGAILTTRQVN